MIKMLSSSLQKQHALFESFLDNWLKDYEKEIPSENKELIKAFNYALKGGKRFRPLLVLSTAKTFQKDLDEVLPFACAVEFIHTYSLIHDDLPAMDNASMRRGRPSHHKTFNEATSILTGDALLTEAFTLAIQDRPSFPYDQSSAIVYLLACAAGGRGMVSGQMMDLQAVKNSKLNLEYIHFCKTGALICICIVGAATLSGLPAELIRHLKDFGQDLGNAFQIADDLEDIHQEKKPQNTVNCAYRWGVKKALDKLHHLSHQALAFLKHIPESQDLQSLVKFNLHRAINIKR